ncbi:cytochrome P450 [Halobacteriales archaeon QS_3_64_16]|nr:MAG: cytochrome P450 [Halobacteriales archaeon QS_3_64_16]
MPNRFDVISTCHIKTLARATESGLSIEQLLLLVMTAASDEELDASERTERIDTPPGPNGWPLVGNTFQLARDPLGFFDRLATHGDVAQYTLGGMPSAAVLHPDYAEQLLVTNWESVGKFQLGEFGGSTNHFAPEGVLFSEGEQWRKQRTMLQNAFTLDRIERYGETMVDVATEHAASWNNGEEVALDVLARTLFDLDIESRGKAVTDVARAVNDRSDPRKLSMYLPSWVPTPTQRRYERTMADFEAVIDDVIAERRGSENLTERDDLLSLLLVGKGPTGYRHSDEELRDQLLTFLFAGHETTSLSLTYTTLLLARYPNVHERLHEEWNDVLGDSDPVPSDLPNLEYADRVLSESLRLYPPAFAVFREAAGDIEIGGYLVPKGNGNHDPAVQAASRPALLRRPGGLRSRSMDRGFRGRVAGLRVLSVRWCTTPLYRDALCGDRTETRRAGSPAQG